MSTTEILYTEKSEFLILGFPKKFSSEDKRRFLCAVFGALSAAVLAYHYLIIFGAGNPDALAEGLLVYTGYDWALACGRWAIRYMSGFLSGNIVIPGLWVPLYALCCGLSAFLICRLWGINKLPFVAMTAVLLTVNPTVIEQSLLQYMFMAWGISNLLCVLFVYLNMEDRSWLRSLLLYPFLIAISFGLYQACLGLLCLMLCMSLILRLTKGESFKKSLLLCLKFALSLLLGVIFYFLIMRFELNRWGEQESGRLMAFSIKEIFTSLPQTLPAAYRTFFSYFFDPVFHRSAVYKLLFAFVILSFLLRTAALTGRRQPVQLFAALLLFLLIPACANVSDIVFPYNKPVLIMQYQSMLVIPFALALMDEVQLQFKLFSSLCRSVALLLTIALAWGYTVSANATYKVYELAYEHTYATVASALDRVWQLPGYYEGEPIAFAGFPDDSVVRESSAANYAYGDYANLIFWEGFPGLQGGRSNYLRHFFGVDGGVLPYEKFIAVLETEDFEEMNIFPLDNSVRRIDGLIVIKFDDEFPLYG